MALLDTHREVFAHVPREISKVTCHFINHGGCVYKFEGAEKMVVYLRVVFTAERKRPSLRYLYGRL